MIYKFILISDEVDDFFREIQISSTATFFDLHKAILESVGYPDDQMTSFFLCEENWEKCEEVTREPMNYGSDTDSWVMDNTPLDELIEDEKQKLVYVFDPMTERCFFMELNEIITGKSMSEPLCTRKAGKAPAQTINFDEMAKTAPAIDVDENFYGDESFDLEDLDEEGFDLGGSTDPDSGAGSLNDFY